MIIVKVKYNGCGKTGRLFVNLIQVVTEGWNLLDHGEKLIAVA